MIDFFNHYPNTDFHELNLDYILKKLNEFDDIVNNKIDIYIREKINKLFVDSVYDESTETLVLVLKGQDDERSNDVNV